MKPAVQHWEVNSRDYKKAKDFYSKVFGWEFKIHEEMSYAMTSAQEENSIGGGIGPVQEGQEPSVTFYITVDDPRAYLDKVEQAGGKTIMPPKAVPDVGTLAMFSDLDGNVIGLYSSEKK